VPYIIDIEEIYEPRPGWTRLLKRARSILSGILSGIKVILALPDIQFAAAFKAAAGGTWGPMRRRSVRLPSS